MQNINIKLDFTFPLVLTVIFMILKGLNIINWAWYWIISPIWIMALIVLVIIITLKIKGRL